MIIARKAAWLCGCAMALVPQIAGGSTSQARLAIGATVITPCRVGTTGALSCAGVGAGISTSAVGGPAALNPPASHKAVSSDLSVKFVEVSF